MGQESRLQFADKFLDLGNHGIARYWEAGNKKKSTIVFLHGVGSGIESWLAQFGLLSNYYYVIALDIPGFGKSSFNGNNYDLKSLLNFLELFIQDKGREEFSFIGHSLGGFLSLEFANAHPSKIRKLILIASGGFGVPSKKFRFLGSKISQILFLPFVKTDFLGPKIFKYFYGNGLPVLAYQKLSQHWKNPMVMKSFVKILRQSDQQELANVSLISCPSLILWGTKDWVLDFRYSLIAKSKLPKAKLGIIDGYGHGLHTEIPDEINSLILDFLSS